VLSSPEFTYMYAKEIDEYPHPDTIKAMKMYLLTGDEWAVKFFEEFGDKL